MIATLYYSTSGSNQLIVQKVGELTFAIFGCEQPQDNTSELQELAAATYVRSEKLVNSVGAEGRIDRFHFTAQTPIE